jgi:hypothetical protein
VGFGGGKRRRKIYPPTKRHKHMLHDLAGSARRCSWVRRERGEGRGERGEE